MATMSSGSSGSASGRWGSSSSGSGRWGKSGSGSGSDGWTWNTAHAKTGEDNYLLRLDKGALKVLNSHLSNRQVWHLAWAVDLAERVKEGRRSKWSQVVNW